MTSFARTSLKAIIRSLHRAHAAEADAPGTPTVLDGLTAVAGIEACAGDGAALGATFPASVAARAWTTMTRRLAGRNRFDRPVSEIEADDPRGAMAAAIGLSMSGERVTTFLSGTDALSAVDLFTHAAGQGLPLVIHLTARNATAHAQTFGSGQESYHALADSGCMLLFATNVQEAVDLSLIARRAAEMTLTPAVIAMDGEATALASQDVSLPTDGLLRDFLGAPSDLIEPPTDAQRMMFGPNRRRVPRWHDLESPRLLVPHQGPESWALGAASRAAYFHGRVESAMLDAAGTLAERTGRTWTPLLEHALSDAKVVLVAQGSAIETAVALCRCVRQTSGRKVGVLGIRCLRPLDSARIAQVLRGARTVAVLERTPPAMGGESPLLREVRGALWRARETDEIGRDQVPRLVGACYGIGGLPLRAADLLAFVDELEEPRHDRYFLGLAFTSRSDQFPKRQAMTDALRRSYPDLASAGVRRDGPPTDIRPSDTTTIAVVRGPSDDEPPIAGELAALLHAIVGGHLRTRPSIGCQQLDEAGVDLVSHASSGVPEPGDEPPVDIVASKTSASCWIASLAPQIASDASIVFVGDRPAIGSGAGSSLTFHLANAAVEHAGDEPCAPMATEMLLGAITRLFLQRSGQEDPQLSVARAAREAMLEELPAPPPAERARRLDAFSSGFETVETITPEQMPATPALDPDEPPIAAPDAGNALAAFWNRIGVLYHKGAMDQLTPDPQASVSAIPALSATLRDVGTDRAVLPIFDPLTFDGTPDTWTCCPDGSLAPLVISARALIDAGIDLAGASGRAADALRAISGQLARRVNKMIREGDVAPTTAGETIRSAGSTLIDGMNTPDKRKASLRSAMDAVVEQLADLPVVATDCFFHEPERRTPGAGELLSVVVNPDACKAGELVASVCEGRGIRLIEQTPESLATARRLWRLWRSLPDTTGATIERACQDERIGRLGGVLLSRHCLMAMSGGSRAEPASGEELALRHALALAESHLQPRLQHVLERAESRARDLAARIHDTLAGVLPDADLNVLAQGLDALGRTDVDLASLSAQVDAAVSGARVDGVRLGRLVDVARGLADLRWRLEKGPEGAGRSRAGLVVGRCAVSLWAGVYPFNPFRSPVVLDGCGQAAHLALGLLEGQLRQSIDGVRLMRLAELELEEPERAQHAAGALATLTYADLTPEERRACPPMILVGDGRTLDGSGLSQLARLLSMPLPIKVLLLTDMGGMVDAGRSVDMLGSSPSGQRTDIALLAMLTRDAYVAQTSIGVPHHFASSVLGAFAFDGPALVNVHAPSPARHGFPAARLFEQARLAVRSRGVPLLTYDPSAGGVFGSRLDLSANPDPEADFAADEHARPVTPADWAASERRFHPHLHPLASDDNMPTPIDEYLALPPSERRARTPFVQSGDDPAQRQRVGRRLVREADDRVRLWRTLQELAGVVTPFTERVRDAARRDVEAAHESRIEDLRREHEARLAGFQRDFDLQATRRVTARLMTLAGYTSSKDGTEGAAP